LLAHFANNTDRIRLGTGVAVAPYWHPVKLAGEAALLDLISGEQLEFGIGRGANHHEFARMQPGMHPHEGVPVMQEMLPVLMRLSQGDYAHEGHYWSFPESTSCPKPVRKPHPPLWVAARDPGTFDWALSHGCNIMTWALTRPFSEVEKYLDTFDAALARNPGVTRPRFMTMRHTAIYEKPGDADYYIKCLQRQGSRFETLFRALAPVVDGFPPSAEPEKLENASEYEPERIFENLIFGTPEEAIERLRPYEAAGIDYFCYNATFGVAPEAQVKSWKLFVDEVVPAFQGQ
jgi:alkanesulfonate monooxygenase SsuD/methylene tetrahydromethanopterin reductase-like flavin-dependent oxidoreductase (luciferase family)